jgi:hypothetical protein
VPFLNKPIPENEYRLLVTSGLSESTDTIAFLQAVLSTFNVLNLLRYENKNIPILPGIVPLFAPVLVCSCPENIFLS